MICSSGRKALASSDGCSLAGSGNRCIRPCRIRGAPGSKWAYRSRRAAASRAEQVKGQINAGPAAGHMVLQVGIEPLVAPVQFGGQGDEQHIQVKQGQAVGSLQPGQARGGGRRLVWWRPAATGWTRPVVAATDAPSPRPRCRDHGNGRLLLWGRRPPPQPRPLGPTARPAAPRAGSNSAQIGWMHLGCFDLLLPVQPLLHLPPPGQLHPHRFQIGPDKKRDFVQFHKIFSSAAGDVVNTAPPDRSTRLLIRFFQPGF